MSSAWQPKQQPDPNAFVELLDIFFSELFAIVGFAFVFVLRKCRASPVRQTILAATPQLLYSITLYCRHIKKLNNTPHLRRLRRNSTPNGSIEYQLSLSLSSVTSAASSRCCSELSFVGVAMSLACQLIVYPSACYTANFQMPNVIQVVSEKDTKTSFVSVSEPMKLTLQNGKNWQLTDPTRRTCATMQ